MRRFLRRQTLSPARPYCQVQHFRHKPWLLLYQSFVFDRPLLKIAYIGKLCVVDTWVSLKCLCIAQPHNSYPLIMFRPATAQLPIKCDWMMKDLHTSKTLSSAAKALKFVIHAGQITGAVAAARAISFDPPSKAVLVAAGARGEEAACNKKSAQLGTPVSGSGLLQAAADIFTGPFSPELNGANENTSAKQKAERHPQPRLMQPQARLELISAYSLRLEEPRAIQKARKTTKGNLPKQMLLKGEL